MSDLVFAGGGRTRELQVVRRPGTRAMRLSVDPRDASVRLSMPPRAALRPALAWAAGKRAWVEAQLAKLPEAQPIVPGMMFEFFGQSVRLEWAADHARRPVLDGGEGRASTSSANSDGRKVSPITNLAELVEVLPILALRVGGPLDSLSPRLTRWLKAEALRVLNAETHALCMTHNLPLTKVAIGDPRGRWAVVRAMARSATAGG